MSKKTFEINIDEIMAKAQNAGLLEKVEEELYFFARLVNTNYDLKVSLESIASHTSQKKEIIREIMPPDTSDVFFEILDNLIEAEKFNMLYQVASLYSTKLSERQNVSLGEIITAVEVPSDFLKNVKEKIGQLSGKQVKLKNFVDSDLLGGVVIKLKGGKIIDTSLKKKLNDLKSYLKGD